MTYSSRPISLSELMGTTPFPNYLLDTIMPTLTDTQWRLLCVVVRQTLGWQAPAHSRDPQDHYGAGQRKSGDWLTHSQLKARTGRSSAVLSQALDTLVRHNLLEVQGGHKQPLVTAQSRQRFGSRLYFRLGPAVLTHILKDYPAAPGSPNNVQHPVPETGKGFLDRGSQKVRTTKASPTKYLSNDKESADFDFGYGPQRPLDGPPVGDLGGPDVRRFLASYVRLFRQHAASGDPPVIDWGKDGKVAKGLLRLYPYDRLEQLLSAFFESRDGWLIKRGYSLAAFRGAINGLLSAEGKQARVHPTLPVVRTGRWSKAGDDGRLWPHDDTRR